jgi:hypothetical protein
MAHTGRYSAQPSSDGMRTTIRTTPGQNYTLTAWIRIASETGTGWGGFRVRVWTKDWSLLDSTDYLLRAQCGTGWYQVALSFTATSNQSIVQLGYVGSAKRTMVVHADDIQVTRATAQAVLLGSSEGIDPVVPVAE